MPVSLVKEAIEQSRGREPVVRAMVLLHGARALTAVDPVAAKRAFAEGTAMAEGLKLHAHERDSVLCEAVQLGAGVDPMAAVALFRSLLHKGIFEFRHHSIGTSVVQSLAQSGDFETAVGLLEDMSIPAGGATIVVRLASDPALQRRAMAAALERWRRPHKQWGPMEEQELFNLLHLFSYHWRKLEPSEQLSWLDEILLTIESGPDSPTNASFCEVTLNSTREVHLFQILHVLHALKPAEEVEAILRRHPEVQKGAEIYPMGMESIWAEARAASAGGSCGTGGGFIMGGGPGDMRLMEGMIKAHRSDPSAVPDLLAEALRLFREDKDPDNPNNAPTPFWPSCRAYQAALYWAGRTLGRDGARLLAEIPDTDLALLASIELAAGALGMAEYSGVRIGPPHRPPDFLPRPSRRRR